MDAAAKTAVVEKYVEAITTNNIEIIKEIYADNATVEDPYGTPAKEGIEAIVEFYSSFPEAQMELTGPVRCAGNAAAFSFKVTIGPKVIEPIDVFEFDDAGKIVSMKAFWGPENMS